MRLKFLRRWGDFLRRYRIFNSVEQRAREKLKILGPKKIENNPNIPIDSDSESLCSRTTSKNNYKVNDGLDYSAYRAQVRENYEPLSNSLFVYERLVELLKLTPTVQVRPMRELRNPIDSDDKVVCLRHDIDADPEKGVDLSKILAREGIPGTFYLLTSANYYGQFVGDTFVRNPMVKTWVKNFIVSGCELGLHNDALGISINYRVNGSKALIDELAYIRSLGAVVTGTVAHNSFPVHMAENFEVFEEHQLWKRDTRISQLLGVLKQEDYGISYEGNYPLKITKIDQAKLTQFLQITPNLKNKEWMKKYLLDNPYMDRDYDNDIWLTGSDSWCCCSRNMAQRFFDIDMNYSEMVDFLISRSPGSRTVITLHPEFFK